MIREEDILQSKILIVDDQDANLVLLERMLHGAGYRCIAMTRHPEAVYDLHLKNHYDLILLDLQMPGMDGFQVMERLKDIEVGSYPPVLVITAQPDHKLRALQAGARDFVSKPFDLAEVLARVHNLLEVRLLHSQAQKLNAQLEAEQKVSKQLLLNVVPMSIAERLKARTEQGDGEPGAVIADYFPDVTVLFADIVEFTKFAESVSINVMVSVLDEIFGRFDVLADKRGMEKIKTIGDSYMVAAGLSDQIGDHASRAAHLALDMLEAMEQFNQKGRFQLNLRIGIDTGAVVAGVIGRRRFIYDLWGDVVNTASRMESSSTPGRIQMTNATRQRLSSPFVIEERSDMNLSAKGEAATWFLKSRELSDRSFDRRIALVSSQF